MGTIGAIAAFVCVFFFVYAVWLLVGTRRDPMKQRLLGAVSPSGRAADVAQSSPSAARRAIQASLNSAMRLFQLKPRERIPGLDKFAFQVAFVSLLGLVGVSSATLVPRYFFRIGLSAPTVFAATAAVTVVLLWLVARLWVHWHRTRWLQEISDGLINVLDLWVLCLGSGMSFHSALVRVTDEKELTNPALREQLLLTNQEILAGGSREDALRHLVRRCGELPDLRSLVAHIIHAERMGGSLAQTLRMYADGLRFKRSQDAKERIQRLPVKLTLPLVFCIFPTLLIVVVGPTWLQLFRVMSSQ